MTLQNITERVEKAELAVNSTLSALEKEIGFPIIILTDYNPTKISITVSMNLQEIRQNTNHKKLYEDVVKVAKDELSTASGTKIAIGKD